MEKSVGDGLRVAPLQDVFRWQDDRLHLKMVGLMKISPLGSLCIKMVLLDSVKFLVFLGLAPSRAHSGICYREMGYITTMHYTIKFMSSR